MARKKKAKTILPDPGKRDATSEAILNDDTITIAEVKEFIADCKKGKREDFLLVAERSWNEIEKRNRRGRLYGGSDLDRGRRWTKFPLWWSCWKIRQPITFARLPIPVVKDTQGDDPVGRTVCVVGERLTKGILKTFNAFPEISASNDDFLITNFGWGRPFFRIEECEEDEKVRLQVVEAPQEQPIEGQEPLPPQPPILLMPDGKQYLEQPLSDEFGSYFLSGKKVTIENEEVYFESGLYSNLYIDPYVTKWSQVTRLGIEYPYTYRAFKKKFGQSALDKIARVDIDEHKTGKPISVFEYWDKDLKEVRWFAENSEDFFQPEGMGQIDAEGIEPVPVDHSDIYGLSGFFPMTEPLLMNASTRDFWPTPEYFQVMDLIDDIHQIVTRLVLLTKAIRIRFLFDSSVKELASLVGEIGEAGAIGIPNLEAALMNGKGTLATLVAYFPVDEMIQGLNNMYTAFDQRLNMFYQITGLNDLIRGATSDVDKTYGERQLEGKYALNRIEPFQRKLQEWIKNNYQLMMEMALKNFSDETLDEYITPQTLDPEDRERYVVALELLKVNRRSRFRIDFETDSTIAINEQWKKQQAIDLVNAATKGMESVAKIAETQPELAKAELTMLKHLIGEISPDGKLFIDEIQESIQQVIDQAMQPKEPEPNVEIMKVQLEGQRLQLDQQKFTVEERFKQLELQSNEQIEVAKLQRDNRMAMIESQLEQFKLQSSNQIEQMKIQSDNEEWREGLEQQYQKIGGDIALAQQELQLKRDELLVELRKVADKKEVDQFALMIDARVAGFEEKLATAQFDLEKQWKALDEQEKFATEQRLQAEHQLQVGHTKIEGLEKIIDIALKKKELDAPLEVKAEPEAKKSTKRVSKVIRNKDGDIDKIVHDEEK